MNETIIAFSKLSDNYLNWFKRIDHSVSILDLYEMEIPDALSAFDKVSGLVLTGGSDVHPKHYYKKEYFPYCRDIDEKRDEMELALIQVATEKKIPILGICRGLQVLNIAFRGTLNPEIPTFAKTNIPHKGDNDVYHKVNIKNNSRLLEMTGTISEVVNSSHHQAIDTLAKGFTATAHSADMIIEAIEADKSLHPFCIGVQWHPERMDFNNPLSGKLGIAFRERV